MTSADLTAREDLTAALHRERAHHDVCRAALAAMIEGADQQVVVGEDVSASGADAEVLGYGLRSRAKALHELPEGPLFFGQLDFVGQGPGHHIGRLRISTHPAAPPLVVDWRAPVSRAFYQASTRDPQGVAIRRRFGWAPGSRGDSTDLTGMEDEYLTVGEPAASVGLGEPGGPGGPGEVSVAGSPAGSGGSGEVSVAGEPAVPGSGEGYLAAGSVGAARGGAVGGQSAAPGVPPSGAEGSVGGAAGGQVVVAGGLLSRELERPRVGPMRDIAATIQPEQDDLVRAALADSVCVQGAPGTGKTAVGLHRAAYLLYTHPQRIRRGGLLILGPNRTFLSYIAEVLPALGETGVRQSTLRDEIARHPVKGEDPDTTAAVKHDGRMAEVLRRAVYGRVTTGPAQEVAVPDGSYRWRVAGHEVAGIVAGVLAEEPPYEVGRERVRSRIVRRIQERAERRAGALPAAWLRRIERARAVSACVDAVWPKLRPEEVLAELLGDREELARAADGLLDEEEQAALGWSRPPRSPRSARWSAADLVQQDE
ncbi:hypothetical protein ACWD25_44165, partial [Streptomyces sp. NPDC002920]